MKRSAILFILLMINMLAFSGCAADSTNPAADPDITNSAVNENTEEDEEMIQTAKTFPDNIYNDIPSGYKDDITEHGTIETFKYTAKTDAGEEYEKTAKVYLPFGYDPENKDMEYNVLYLMHGGGDNESRYWGAEELEKVLDAMFEKGDCEPCIVVTPNYRIPGCDETASAKGFYKELIGYLIPALENEYNTYAQDTTPDGIKASRLHRAYAGFSMGACSTWAVFANCLDEIAYYIPISGDCWEVGGSGKDKAEYLAGRVSEMGYTADDFYIYAGCGHTGDMAYPNMVPQLEAMKELTDAFIYCDNFADGNFYYYQFISSGHSIDTAIRTVYNALPKFFG